MRGLDQAAQLNALQDCIVGLRAYFDVAHCVYHWVSADGEQYGCGTYPTEWVQHYVEQDYVRADPVIAGCFQRFHPVDWKELDWSGKAARSIRKESMAFGIGRQGYSIPVRGPNGQFALFSVTHDCDDAVWASFQDTYRRDLILCAHAFNAKALELARQRLPEPVKPLSGREIDVLTYLAMGYGRGQIAQMLSISEHTLRTYIEGARFKLGAANTIQAVARAVAEGFIVIGGAVRHAEGDWPGRGRAANSAAAE